jgi:site-specific DNA-cytosine methylase
MARLVHIGRKVPKGFIELPGASHLGRGIWALPMAKQCEFKDAGTKHRCRREHGHDGAHIV